MPFDFQVSKLGVQLRPEDYLSVSNPLMESLNLDLLSDLINMPLTCVEQ